MVRKIKFLFIFVVKSFTTNENVYTSNLYLPLASLYRLYGHNYVWIKYSALYPIFTEFHKISLSIIVRRGALTVFHCLDKCSVMCFFCTSAAGAGLTGSKMATRIGSLEEFELKEVEGIHQGVSSKFQMSLYHPKPSRIFNLI